MDVMPEPGYKYLIPGVNISGSPWTSRLTQGLLWFVSLAWLGVYIAGLCLSSWQLASLHQNPLLGLGVDGLLRMGATAGRNIIMNNEWWRLASSPFINAGAIHLACNVSMLWTFGIFLSTALSPWQLGLLLLASGAAGTTVSANMSLTTVTAAASSLTFGLMGGVCAALLLHRQLFCRHAVSALLLGATLLLNVFVGATPFVDNSSNIAGFVTGALVTLGCMLLGLKGVNTRGHEWALRLLCMLALGAAVSIPVLGVLGLNLSTPIAGCCDHLVCYPNPLWDCSAAQLPTTCTVTHPSATVVTLHCPNGDGRGLNYTGSYTDSDLQQMCAANCYSTSGSTPAQTTAFAAPSLKSTPTIQR